MLLSFQIFTRKIKKIKSFFINFASQRNFKQTFECLFIYQHSNIEEKEEWIGLLNKLPWLKMQVMLTFFGITIWKYLFVNFLSIFSLLQCLYIVRFGWDIVLSSSHDGWDKRGYTIWYPGEGTSTLLNSVWLYLKVVKISTLGRSGLLLLKVNFAWS